MKKSLVTILFRVSHKQKYLNTPFDLHTLSPETGRIKEQLSLSLSLSNAQTGQRRETTDSV
jgi:hypothetical protein